MSATVTAPDTSTPMVALDLITSQGNLRRETGDTAELEASIAAVGLIEPLVVRSNGKGYDLLAGHRRLEAVTNLGWKTVPVHVVDTSASDADVARIAIQLVENLQRHDLDPVEEAQGYAQLKAYKWRQSDIAKRVGRSEALISKRLALLKLPSVALDMGQSGQLGSESLYELTKVLDAGGDINQVLDTINVNKRADQPILHDDVEQTVKNAVQRAGLDTEIAGRRRELEAAGVTVIEVKGYDKWGQVQLPKGRIGYGGALGYIRSDDHTDEPCHAVCVYGHYGAVYESSHCTDQKRHNPDGDSELKAEQPPVRDTSYDDEWAKRAERADLRKKVLLAAGREILGGRAPAKDKIIDRVVEAWVKDEWYSGDSGDALILLALDTEDDEQWPDLAELYEQADGPNRTKILVALLLSRMISDAGWPGVPEDGDEFRSTLAFYRDLGRPIELSKEIKAVQTREKKADEAEGKAQGR